MGLCRLIPKSKSLRFLGSNVSRLGLFTGEVLELSKGFVAVWQDLRRFSAASYPLASPHASVPAMKLRNFAYLAGFVGLLLGLPACQSPGPRPTLLAQRATADRRTTEASGKEYAISTQGKASTQAAEQMYQAGGNMIDAAVAASFTIAVERPHSTGISGGGFLLFRDAKTKKIHAVDFRERAPLKATEGMFLGSNGKAVPRKSIYGPLSVAVPGMVAGLYEIHQKFGKLPWEKVLQPAIQLAEQGFPVYPSLHGAMLNERKNLAEDPAARKIFLDPKMQAWPEGKILIQKDLAATLRKIAKEGKKGFYEGSVGARIVNYMNKNHGLISKQDFAEYKVIWRTPVEGEFKGYKIFSMPPPSSGGIHVIQFLNFLENDNLAKAGPLSKQAIHLEAAALQSAFTDRAQYLGDPDFWKVPVKGLTSKEYSRKRRSEVNLDKARTASEIMYGDPEPYESTETTHLSIMDKDGNAVATTQTINGYFGAGVVVPETGIVLNNEMDDFSAQVGAQNLFGAVGGKANAIVPKKTPLSSMSPTIVMKNDIPVMSLGAPGGTRIISCVAQTIFNHLEFQLPLFDSVAMIRLHHQWKPDVLTIDPPGPDYDTRLALEQMGYNVEIESVPCYTMAISRDVNGLMTAVSDPRDSGMSLAK